MQTLKKKQDRAYWNKAQSDNKKVKINPPPEDDTKNWGAPSTILVGRGSGRVA